jgi:hypothetical protein
LIFLLETLPGRIRIQITKRPTNEEGGDRRAAPQHVQSLPETHAGQGGVVGLQKDVSRLNGPCLPSRLERKQLFDTN